MSETQINQPQAVVGQVNFTWETMDVVPETAGNYDIIFNLAGNNIRQSVYYSGGARGAWSEPMQGVMLFATHWLKVDEAPDPVNVAPAEGSAEATAANTGFMVHVNTYRESEQSPLSPNLPEIENSILMIAVQKLHLTDIFDMLHLVATIVPSAPMNTEDEQAAATRWGAALLDTLLTRELIEQPVGRKITNTRLGNDVAENGFVNVAQAVTG